MFYHPGLSTSTVKMVIKVRSVSSRLFPECLHISWCPHCPWDTSAFLSILWALSKVKVWARSNETKTRWCVLFSQPQLLCSLHKVPSSMLSRQEVTCPGRPRTDLISPWTSRSCQTCFHPTRCLLPCHASILSLSTPEPTDGKS